MNRAEKKIYAAFKKAASYCASGKSPNEALIKAATEEELNFDMTKRACEQLNISLSLSHFKKSAGDDKASDFPIANFDEVAKAVFAPELNKSASLEIPQEPAKERLAFGFTRKRVKTASAPEKSEYVGSLEHLITQAEGCKRVAMNKVSELSMKLETERQNAFENFRSLVDHFRTIGNIDKYAEFEEQCYSEYGESIQATLDLIFDHLPESAERGNRIYAKRALRIAPQRQNGLFDAMVSGFAAIDEITRKHAEAAQELESMTKEIGSLYRKAAGLDEVKTSASDLMEKGAFILGDVVTPEIVKSVNEKSITDHLSRGSEFEATQRYRRPVEEADMELDNVRRKAILQDLLTNDDIIAGQDVGAVNAVYNSILSMAPSVTLDREVMRSILRSAASQQAIDPFTAKQVVELEGQKLKNKQMASGKPAEK